MLILNFKIEQNTVSSKGFIYNRKGIFEIENVIFENNIISNGGYIINHQEGGTFYISRVSIVKTNENTTTYGTIFVVDTGVVNISSSSITNNQNTIIIQNVLGKVNINDSILKNNTTSENFIYNQTNSIFNMNRTIIEDNNIGYSLLWNQDVKANIINTEIINNVITRNYIISNNLTAVVISSNSHIHNKTIVSGNNLLTLADNSKTTFYSCSFNDYSLLHRFAEINSLTVNMHNTVIHNNIVTGTFIQVVMDSNGLHICS